MLELSEVTAEDRGAWRPVLVERAVVLRLLQQYDDTTAATEEAGAMIDRALPRSRLFEVSEGEARVGFVWWGRDGEDGGVYDAQIYDPSRVGELLPALVVLARESGAGRVAAGAVPSDPTLTALVELPRFVTRATNMQLWLDRPVADPAPLELTQMAETDFDAFFNGMLTGYTAELAASGMSEEAATEQASRQTAELIPDGLASPCARFFTGWVDGEQVGRLWIGTERPMAFVYELEVEESQRRKGFGEAIMNAGARWCQDQGIASIGLNVFGHNPGARRLYEKLGYDVTVDYRTYDVPDGG